MSRADEFVESSVVSDLETTGPDGEGHASAFEVFRKRQDVEYVSDFDREVRRIEGKEP